MGNKSAWLLIKSHHSNLLKHPLSRQTINERSSVSRIPPSLYYLHLSDFAIFDFWSPLSLVDRLSKNSIALSSLHACATFVHSFFSLLSPILELPRAPPTSFLLHVTPSRLDYTAFFHFRLFWPVFFSFSNSFTSNHISGTYTISSWLSLMKPRKTDAETSLLWNPKSMWAIICLRVKKGAQEG